jgi:hypothetical protein
VKPYYEHAGITIYHLQVISEFVVECDVWMRTSERDATGLGSEARMFQSSGRGRSGDSNNQRSTLSNGLAGDRSTMLGRATAQVSRLYAPGHRAYSNSVLARSAANLGPTAITKTATHETTRGAISRFFARGTTS